MDQLYFWSARRQGWVVLAHGVIQTSSYVSVRLLKMDWPEAVEA